MPLATIHKIGEGNVYHVHWLEQRTDPGFGRPGGGHPDHDLPGHGHPDQGLPGGGHISNRPPGSVGGIPGNELPDHAPPVLAPGYTIVMVRGGAGKWEYAFIAPGDPPPKPLPGPPPHPGNRPPGSGPPTVGGGPMPGAPNRPDNTLPTTPEPKPA